MRFLGQRGDVPALLAAADVVVVPSHWEGQPLIVQEALRAGAPLVASRVGGIPDLTGEDAALLVPPRDNGKLAAAVLSVLGDQALAHAGWAPPRWRGRPRSRRSPTRSTRRSRWYRRDMAGAGAQRRRAKASCFSQSADNKVQYAIFTADRSVLVTSV